MDSISLDNVLQANAPSGQLNQSMFQVITTASSTRKVGVVVGYCLAVGVIATTLCHCTPRQPHSQQHTFCRLFFFGLLVIVVFLLFAGGQKRLCVREPASQERVVVRDQQCGTGPEEEALRAARPERHDE